MNYKIEWGQFDIPKDHNSEWFLFRKVIISKIFIPKGYYSKDFYPKGRYSKFRNNDPSGSE